MNHPNLDLINLFFEAYGRRDMDDLHRYLDENITWSFLGQHPLGGVRKGIPEVLAFFDTMGAIMAESNPKVDRLVSGVNDQYVVECQHIWTNRADGQNLDYQVCVLWKFEKERIVSGTHFFANPQSGDTFFNHIAAGK